MPSRCSSTGPPSTAPAHPDSAELSAGVVELAPAVAIAHHPLQVLAPGDVVVQRVPHDGADDAAGDVGRPQRRRRRSGRPAPGRWSPRRSPRPSTACRSAPSGWCGRPSVTPSRSSRKIVTTRRISSAAAGTSGRPRRAPSSATRRATMAISSSALAGSGSTTVLNRRRSAPDSSLTPRSRSLAVAIEVEAVHGRDLGVQLGHGQHLLGQDRDERVLHLGRHAGELLDAHRAGRSASPRYTGLGTSAASLGPSASRRA